MEQALIDYFYQFHVEQHYFLCHDILEECWKAQPTHSKKDAIVSLILLATGAYHYRRQNYVGAHRTFMKAQKIIKEAPFQQVMQLGVNFDQYINMLEQLIEATSKQSPFAPIEIPITTEMYHLIIQQYPNYQLNLNIVHHPYIKDYHKYRDRSSVIDARIQALYDRQNKRERFR